MGRRTPGIRRALIVALAFASIAATLPQSRQSDEIVVEHRARTVQAGEVVLLRVTAARPVESVLGRQGRDVVRFYPTADPRVWEGLLGLDLDVTPGVRTVQIEAVDQERRRFERAYELRIVPKDFPTRRLTVKAAFVTPPESELARIQRESKRVASIFQTTSERRLWSGPFVAPVPGQATSSFGVRSILNGQPRSPHSGTDFRAAEGTPVVAPNAGTVVLSDDLYFSGKTVILDHGWGLYSYFAHLSRAAVSDGDRVATGDPIGHAGATGRVTGPHLHWAVRLQGTRVDALSLMALLPQ